MKQTEVKNIFNMKKYYEELFIVLGLTAVLGKEYI